MKFCKIRLDIINFKITWHNAYFAVILYVGSNLSNLDNKSIAYESTSRASNYLNPCGLQLGNVLL